MRPTTDREPPKYLARDDRPERHHRDGIHRTAGSDHPSAAPSSQNPRRSTWCGDGISVRGRRQIFYNKNRHSSEVLAGAPFPRASWGKADLRLILRLATANCLERPLSHGSHAPQIKGPRSTIGATL